MTAETKIEFDRDRALEYDLDIRKAIPGYEALHDMGRILLQNSLTTSAKLLVVGCGTGVELINYCQHNPEWRLTGVDPSHEMIAIAQEKLANQGFSARVDLHTGYINTLTGTEPMDAATLILVMHFLPNDGAKLQLLQNIAQHLKPGANLILADLYGDQSLPYFAQFKHGWKYFYLSRLDEASKIKAEPRFLPSIENSIHFITEAKTIELLQVAGFNQVTKFYNAFLFGGWIAKYTGS